MPITLSRITVAAYRVPISSPVATSFGVMHNRPAVFVRLEDGDGAFGWGEVFANWPAAGAEHRARLLVEDMGDLLLGQPFDDASELFTQLTEKTHIRALQCGEWGPFRQVIAGLDTAMTDLVARRAGLSVAQYLNPQAEHTVPCYASGIAIGQADHQITQGQEAGFSTYKVKVGFDLTQDTALLTGLFSTLGAGETLCADANQAWALPEAERFVAACTDLPLGWLEEPLPADASLTHWRALADQSPIPLAGGENITGTGGFADAIATGVFGVLQPDIAKWGGFSGCWPVAQAIRAAGQRYCPHYLGGGIGLIASAHLLAAAGGDGLLEVDVNPNPLRDAFDTWQGATHRGTLTLSDAPGLGITHLPDEIAEFVTYSRDLHI
ncbi:mandelate racemase/muconate lactonizing enzyme family protein [Marivita cryptomonadis]|uniref:Mandelate racemase/muconate lactonizing enzyme family protein n=2 Tax=Roseobacteraceae TaxID=2854170 RepID=A0A9Q2S5J2_9RHOB|nr:mandelate racemase/muconate lactonizing enzyme family protein [Marivita cryptomonadis]MBM2331800.1 mandelate racemase/muconate lactonizing enzyme family protein [Marivita cryptomonadis]MBM2341385.1 mandelate racemase/muconate lactonizing enzyme family protein [Marivita cryptomonadis]MBM2346048.1 mandelate racemase/muconate lactonizing enzyme family protein [Marivita cryptomonadis]MBM2350725.1 mandelate racemase/muconate lactonizing enzyme family protein [Marivita cryptomonadis]